MCMVLDPEGPVVDLVNRNGSWLVSGAGVVPGEVVAVSLVVDGEDEVNGYGYEVMGMVFVLVDKDGMNDALEVWVDRLVSLVVDCEDEVNGYGYEVMGMLFVLVDKDGMKDALEVWVDRLGVLLGTVDIVVSSVLDPSR